LGFKVKECFELHVAYGSMCVTQNSSKWISICLW